MLNGKSILVTGGTGSFGKAFCERVLKDFKPKRLVVYSRDEFKQAEMAQEKRFEHPAIRFFLGDVRDKERLTRAMSHIDYVIHAAALKQVPAAEYNPHEFIKTNIDGAMNVVEAAINAQVQGVVALSTDKAVNPVNLYGATKLCSDKIFVAANSYSGENPTRFSVVRYGNVVGSRGSVIPRFLREREQGALTVTDPAMTRFYITLEAGVDFVLSSLEQMRGGEIFIPKIPSCRLDMLAAAVAPGVPCNVTGPRPGEKTHEILIPQDESGRTVEMADRYIILPVLNFWAADTPLPKGAKACDANFSYSSDNNPHWMNESELKSLIGQVEQAESLAAV